MAESNYSLIWLLEILQTTDKKSPLNARQIDEIMFDQYGTHITRQMAYKHIEVLRTCGYKIANCERKNDGWYMESHAFDDAQLKIMIDSIQQSNCLPPPESQAIVRELLRSTSARSRRKLLSLYQPQPREKAEDKIIRKNLDTILEAALLGRKIEFHYTYMDDNMTRQLKYDRQGPKTYELNVFTLQWAGEIYYVIGGHDKYRPSLTQYRLDRMRDVSISEKKLTKKEDFLGENPEYQLQKYISQSVNHFSGQPVSITLEFHPGPMELDILYDFAGKSLRMTKMENGKARAVVRKYKSPTLTGWLLEYAETFEVIEPKEIREELREKARKIAERYRD